VPLRPDVVRMYVCGMTVYDYCHLGHARVEAQARACGFGGIEQTFETRRWPSLRHELLRGAQPKR